MVQEWIWLRVQECDSAFSHLWLDSLLLQHLFKSRSRRSLRQRFGPSLSPLAPPLVHFRLPSYCPHRRVMASVRDLLMLLITVQLHLSTTSSLSPHTGVRRSGGSGKRQGGAFQSPEEGMLVLGETCGVYTLVCRRGLRCLPPEGDQSPLQALLQGKGTCRSIKESILRTTTSGTSTKTPIIHLNNNYY